MPPTNDVTNQSQPYASYGYPNVQPAYQQAQAHAESSPSHNLYSQPGYQQYTQVRMQLKGDVLSFFS